MQQAVQGFSKFSKEEKVRWIAAQYFENEKEAIATIRSYWNSDKALQKLHDDFIENTITNYYLPLGVAPNFKINNELVTIPMAIEESSVVAAASNAAKFWLDRGGFKAEVIDTKKIGQVHFMYNGDTQKLQDFFKVVKPKMIDATDNITANMQKRGGGILDIILKDKTSEIAGYYQLHATFETVDSMGANFINSCLEQFAITFREEALCFDRFSSEEKQIQIVMSILSNYVPECIVRAEVSCKVSELNADKDISPEEFAEKFVRAVQIAEIEPYRAVTHNKGIMNGIDAVVLATGNDFRAIEAGAHAYASKNGSYSSLSHAEVKNGIFKFWIEIPLAVGTVGGLTSLHPMVKLSLEMLGKPSARKLMQIMAVAGLAQNFAALRSLTTTGIQKGHMKMHLKNILNQLEATIEERKHISAYFTSNTISHSAVIEAMNKLRN